jgi:hypothetical protein
MLSFEATNFRSIRDTVHLNLTRASRDEVPEFTHPGVVPAVAILGANAAGKSNLLRALNTMFWMIRTSATRVEDKLPYTPYMLGDAVGQPTTFQVVVLLDDVRYDYGFSFDGERILAEWLRSWPRGRQRTLFTRDVETVDVWQFGDSLTGANQALAKATRDDALLFSTARLLNHDVLGPIQQQFASLVTSLSSESFGGMLQPTLKALVDNPRREDQVRGLITHADLGIVDLAIREEQVTEQHRETTRRLVEALRPDLTPEQLRAELSDAPLQAVLSHQGVSGEVDFPFAWESTGTRNFFVLLGPVLERLTTGGVLVIDEIDASLHPRLVSELVRLFQEPDRNPNQAQLILSTHDVTVMMNVGDYNVLYRDQLWFVDKTDEGVSRLRPLTSFSPRKGEVYSRNYLNDRYGGVPRINSHDFPPLWGDTHEKSPRAD